MCLVGWAGRESRARDVRMTGVSLYLTHVLTKECMEFV